MLANTATNNDAYKNGIFYSLGVPVNFRRDDVTGTIPGAPQQNTTELDFRAVSAVSLAQVKYINPAVVGERHDGLRGFLAAAAAHAESGPCSCAHKTNQATSATVCRGLAENRAIEIATANDASSARAAI